MADQSSMDSEAVARMWFIATVLGAVAFIGTIFAYVIL